MKKKMFSIINWFMIFLLVACGMEQSTETKDWDFSEHSTVNNFEGVSMTVKEKSVSAKGLTLQFKNQSDQQGTYSEDFLLERKINGAWYQVPPIIDDYGFNDIGYELGPGEVRELSLDWDWLYGSLDPGDYRIIKTILDVREAGDYDEYYLAASFIIGQSSK